MGICKNHISLIFKVIKPFSSQIAIFDGFIHIANEVLNSAKPVVTYRHPTGIVNFLRNGNHLMEISDGRIGLLNPPEILCLQIMGIRNANTVRMLVAKGVHFFGIIKSAIRLGINELGKFHLIAL